MSIRRSASVLSIVALWALPVCAQNTIYFHNFSGAAGVPLHGLAPTTDNNGGGNTWLTRTDTGTTAGTGRVFFADGTITASTAPDGQGSATLAFTPTPGFIYTLSASFGDVTATADNWVALGFTQGQSAGGGNGGRFIGAPTAGQPWMLYRGNVATQPDQTFLGPGTANVAAWSTTVTPSRGAPVDLRIVLDTTQPLWSAQWLAKNPGDANYTLVDSRSYTANPTIGGVGIAVANTSVLSTVSGFRLETNGPIFVPGDVNGDGLVNLADFNIISNNLFNSVTSRAQGDLNGDGIVDFVDFRTWKSIFEAGGGAFAGLSVPEPASGVLAASILLCAAGGWRRNRR